MRIRLRVRFPAARRRRRRSDARLDRAWPSDARRSESPGAHAAPDPEAERRRRLRLAAIGLFLSLVFVGSTLAAVFGDSGFLDLRRRHREIEELTREVERRQAAVAALDLHVKRLQTDPTAIERIAREDLGLVAPGEISFLLPREEPDLGETAPPPADPAPGPEQP
ncbi:MAG TPA: septum formation initiator family protein [Candidatus Polarisedimenticolaceae bacterium]|nr:septum formation initiator family protein [Candidatus Polarisedimenticolaceae bacterium]